MGGTEDHARCDTGIERLQRAAHKHQRSPGFRPGKPISGTGVLRSLPRDLLNASISSVISAHIIWAPTSSGPVSQQPVRQNARGADGARLQFLAEDVSILRHGQTPGTLHSPSNRGAGR
jgi:hypothetical protein